MPNDKRLALAVYLNGKCIGTSQMLTQGETLKPWSIQDGIEGCIALACFARKDDLLATHSMDEFEVKGVAI